MKTIAWFRKRPIFLRLQLWPCPSVHVGQWNIMASIVPWEKTWRMISLTPSLMLYSHSSVYNTHMSLTLSWLFFWIRLERLAIRRPVNPNLDPPERKKERVQFVIEQAQERLDYLRDQYGPNDLHVSAGHREDGSILLTAVMDAKAFGL